MIYARICGGPRAPTDVTIRDRSSKARVGAPRTSCRLPIVRCALLVVNARHLYENRQRANHSGIIAARWETGRVRERGRARGEREWEKERWGRGREAYANPFNRESIYITDLPNNNSVSPARCSRIIPHHLAICRSRTSHRRLLPISRSIVECDSGFRSSRTAGQTRA